MNIGIIRTTSLDGLILPEPLAGALYMNENQAHRFAISCTSGGRPVSLTGSVTGRFIRADGQTVLLTGSVSGGVAYVTLPQACYIVPGRFIMAIFNVANGATTTIYAAAGNIARTQTGTIIDPGSVIPNIDDLLAEIDNMRQATAAANAAATKAVRYNEAQTLTAAEQAQARGNISAPSAADLAATNTALSNLSASAATKAELAALADGKAVRYDVPQTLVPSQMRQGRDNLNAADALEANIAGSNFMGNDLFMRGSLDQGTVTDVQYRIVLRKIARLSFPVTVVARTGFRIYVATYYENGNYRENSGWQTSYTIPKDTNFRITIARDPDDTSETATINTFTGNVIVYHGEVRYDSTQALSEASQAQARANIGAASAAELAAEAAAREAADSDLKSAYNDLYTEINDDADIPSSVSWYQGSFYPSTGGDNNTPTNRIRSGWVTLTKDIVGLRPISGYKYEIFAWNAAQTYIGAWNGSEWSKIDGKFFTEPFYLTNFDKTNKYKFVLAHTDNTAITTAESVNLKYVCSRIVDIENDIENLGNTDAQLDAKINQYMHKQAFDVDESWTTPFIIENGETVHINVTAVTGSINVFTLGYPSTTYLQITQTGEYTFTATNTGAIRFYLGANNSISGTVWIDSRIDAEKNRIDDVYSPGAITPIMGDLEIKTKNVFNSFTINSGSFSFTVGVSNISNYTDYATASSVSKNTPPVRIRDFDGQLIYNNLRLNLDKVSKPTTCMWLFDKNGYYLRAVTHSEFYHRTNVANYFKADEYFVIFNLFPGVSGYEDYAWIVDNVNIEWLNATPEYHVGAGKEFTTFNGMLTALADDPREKIVYIDPGEYDIFAEYGGAEYMASLADTAAQMNWRDVCKVVPPNTHIIGLGSVTLKWIATAEEMQNSSVATLFSPLNVSGNCIIENIKVIGQNCRYAVHDETSGLAKYDGAIHHYKNCYFECLQSTYNATTPYGSGHNKNMTLIFDDCEFVNYQNNAWATHHQAATAAEKSTIIFNHCIFRRSKTESDFYVQFTTDKTNGLKDEVRFNGCYIAAKIKFYTASSSEVQQGYDVTLVGSSQVEVVYSANVTTRYDVRQLNAVTQITL